MLKIDDHRQHLVMELQVSSVVGGLMVGYYLHILQKHHQMIAFVFLQKMQSLKYEIQQYQYVHLDARKAQKLKAPQSDTLRASYDCYSGLT